MLCGTWAYVGRVSPQLKKNSSLRRAIHNLSTHCVTNGPNTCIHVFLHSLKEFDFFPPTRLEGACPAPLEALGCGGGTGIAPRFTTGTLYVRSLGQQWSTLEPTQSLEAGNLAHIAALFFLEILLACRDMPTNTSLCSCVSAPRDPLDTMASNLRSCKMPWPQLQLCFGTASARCKYCRLTVGMLADRADLLR